MNSIEVLRQRQLEGWAPGDDDGNKLYAAVDGGGMAGVVSLGALHQLGEMGLLDHFDGFAGSSAGSLNAAYAMTGQTLEGRDVYVDYLTDNKFMSWKRPLWVSIADSDFCLGTLPLPFVNMGVLSDAVTDYRPLKVDELKADHRELAIGLSNLKTATPEIATNHDTGSIIYYLLLGAKLPLGLTFNRNFFGSMYEYGDAGLLWPSTDTIARRRGANYIISFATGSQPTRATSITQKVADSIQAKWFGRYSAEGKTNSYDSFRYRDYVNGRFVMGNTVEIENTSITRIYPEGKKIPTRQTRDKKLLAKGFDAGRTGAVTALRPIFTNQKVAVS